MNRRISTALVAACVISGGCTYVLGKRMKAYASSQQQQMLRYVAPSHAVAAGAVLAAADVEWTAWPASTPLAGALLKNETAIGRAVLFPVEQGQPLLERDLSAPGTGGGLGSRIPDGMRAVALRSDEVVGVAGFLLPGSRLDVLVTYHTASSADAMTTTVVQNAEVLAAGQQAEPDPAGKPTIATVVTLLLSPLDAERAVAASTQGTIHFVLRNVLDHGQMATAPVSLSWLSGGGGPPPAVAAPAVTATPEAPRPKHTDTGVETVLGGDGNGSESGGAGGGHAALRMNDEPGSGSVNGSESMNNGGGNGDKDRDGGGMSYSMFTRSQP